MFQGIEEGSNCGKLKDKHFFRQLILLLLHHDYVNYHVYCFQSK